MIKVFKFVDWNEFVTVRVKNMDLSETVLEYILHVNDIKKFPPMFTLFVFTDLKCHMPTLKSNYTIYDITIVK